MPRPGRRFIFFYQLTLLLGLLALAFAYYQTDAVIDVVPVVFQGLPVQVAWFGALGGVVISLKGVYDHPAGTTGETPKVLAWDDKWLLWHLGRPFSGMVAGIITLVLLKAIYPKGSPAQAIVFAAAFILGTQERRFFEFLKQVGAVIVAVPDKKQRVDRSLDGQQAATWPVSTLCGVSPLLLSTPATGRPGYRNRRNPDGPAGAVPLTGR